MENNYFLGLLLLNVRSCFAFMALIYAGAVVINSADASLATEDNLSVKNKKINFFNDAIKTLVSYTIISPKPLKSEEEKKFVKDCEEWKARFIQTVVLEKEKKIWDKINEILSKNPWKRSEDVEKALRAEIDAKIKELDPIVEERSVLFTLYNQSGKDIGKFRIRHTSGLKNNCLFFSIYNQNKDLIQEIMGEKWKPTTTAAGMCLQDVRVKIFSDIKQNLVSIEYIRKRLQQRFFKGECKKIKDLEKFLDDKAVDGKELEECFIDIMDVVYDEAIHYKPFVLAVSQDQGDKKDSLDIIFAGDTISKNTDAIFIHHWGGGTRHFSSLERVG